MARSRSENEPSTYHERPAVPSEMKRRFELMKAVLGDRITISEAARELGIARVNMQSLAHRVEAAMVEALTPRPSGPRPKPESEKHLEARVKELEKRNAKLEEQLQAADAMMGAAGEIIRSLRGLPPRNSASRSAKPRTRARASSSTSSRRSARPPTPPTPNSEDPEPATPDRQSPTLEAILSHALSQLATTSNTGVRAARLLGVDPTTLRRWLRRLARGEPLQRRRGGARAAIPRDIEQRVRDHVTALHGLVGAASLAHSIVGVSRRAAAEIKQRTLVELERERKRDCSHVVITSPGVVRGFDAMYLANGFALVAADAAIPFRTSIVHVDRYDAKHVVEVLERDFAEHGPPLVWRRDRARCQATDEVMSLLERYRVLPLQGPPHYPQYYGQLERQNREHDAWLQPLRAVTQSHLDAMRTALNCLWRRPTLAWRSAAELWAARPPLDDDRYELYDEVQHRAAKLRAQRVEEDLAMRLAIEQALTQRGLLKITPGRSLLRE